MRTRGKTVPRSPEEKIRSEELVRRGREAQEILQNPIVKGALDTMELAAIEAFKRAPDGDMTALLAAQRAYASAVDFRGLLTSVMNTGRLEGERASRADAEEEASSSLDGWESLTPNERRRSIVG